MRAAFHDRQGAPEVLQFGELPDAVAGPSDVLIRAHASSLDRVDLYFRTGANGMRLPPGGPHIGGRDVAGVIEVIGADAAVAFPDLLVGMPVVGVAVRSAHAELVAVPGSLVFPLPTGCSFEDAAAIPTAGRTAYDGLMNRGRLSPGERVLVISGSSGVGSFGIQIARAAGASVITTVGAAWKVAPAQALGAEAVIDHYTEDVAARVRELTGEPESGVDVVLDPVGAATFPAAMKSLRREGRYVTTGVTAGHHANLHLGKVFERGLTVTGVGRPSNESIRVVMQRLLALVATGEVRPAVQAVFPLEEMPEAHRLLESSAVFGKLVIAVAR
jgi:NADPH2:quinone reductase